MQAKSETIQSSWLSLITLTLAIVTRLITYIYNRSLFLDEAVLARNIFEKNWQGLLGILDNNQSAPIGFLLTSKFFVSLLGHSEYVLRLLPLLIAIIACILLYKVGQSIEARIVPLLMIWFATSNINLRYATEFKQYSSDLMFSLLLLFIAIQLLKNRDIRHVFIWTIASVIAVWFSHASVFVIAGIGLTVIVILFREKQWRVSGAFITGCFVAMLSFFTVYFNFYQYTASGTDLADTMQTYWVNDFFQLNLTWLIRFPFLIFQFIAEFNNPILLVIIIFGFIIGLGQLDNKYIALILMPVLFTLIASNLTLYPLRNRFLLFILPGFMIIISAGLIDFDSKLVAAGKYVQWGVRLFILILLVWTVNLPQTITDVRGILQDVESVSEEMPILYTSERVAKITYYYGYSYQEVLPDTTLDDIELQSQAVWIILSDAESDYSIIEEIGSEPDIQRKGVSAFCVDGIEQSCP